MITGIIGVVIVVWAIWAGIGTRENNRALIFQGPVGSLVNIAVIVIGIAVAVAGFW